MPIGTPVKVSLALVPSICQVRTAREQPLHDALPFLRAHLQQHFTDKPGCAMTSNAAVSALHEAS